VTVPRPVSSKDGVGGRSKSASVVLSRRAAHGAHVLGKPGIGVRGWQTPGDPTPRKGNRVKRRARRRSRGCARTLCVSFAEVDRRFWLTEALPPNVISRKRDGGRGGREPGQRMYQSSKVASAVPGGARFSDEALRCEAVRGEGSRGRRKTEHRKAGCATPRSPARETRKGSSGTAEEPSQASPR